MNSLLLIIGAFFLGSGSAQYALKQISVNFSNNRFISLTNLLYGAVLVTVMLVGQGCYLYALQRHRVTVVYPLSVGSSILGVTCMATMILNERLSLGIVLGSSLILAGIVLMKAT